MKNHPNISQRALLRVFQLFETDNRYEISASISSLGYDIRMDLYEKIKKIEALIASSKNDGERQAAELAKNRILDRQQQDFAAKPVEYKVSLDNHWKKKLLVALCSKYKICTFRYKGQKYTTVRFWGISSFVDTVLWPEFKKYADLLEGLVQEIVTGLIDQIHKVKEDEVVVAGELTAAL